jgi:hypothetical protein
MIAEAGTISAGRLARDLKFDSAIDPRLQGAIRIGDVDLGQQGPGPRLEGVGDPSDLAMEREVGHRGDANDGLNPGLNAKGAVLRYINPDTDHIAVSHREHRRPAGSIGSDQAANVDIPLGYHAIKWCGDLLIDLLLVRHFQLCLCRCGTVTGRLRRLLLSVKSISIGVTLLPRHPALIDENRVASPGNLGQRTVGVVLALRRFGLLQSVLILSNLVIDFRCSDLREQLPSLDVVADIDIAFQHIAAGAPINVCLLEAERRRGQCHVQVAKPLRDLLDVDARDKIGLLFGSVADLPVLRIMPPHPKSERTRNKDEDAEPEQPASGTASPPALARRVGRILIGCRKQRPLRRSFQH